MKTFGGHPLSPQEPGNHWRREARPKPGLEEVSWVGWADWARWQTPVVEVIY